MWYIITSVIILGILCGWLGRSYRHKSGEQPLQKETAPSTEVPVQECCGAHEVCEKESLLAAVSKDIEYYDDEELDIFKGISSDNYTEHGINEFREILYTLKSEEVAGWIRSLQLREIELPDELKDEIFLIIGERRNS